MTGDIARRLTSPVALFGYAIFALLIAPAMLNGFPLVMSDSIAYSGEGVNWMRAKSPALLMTLPYKALGYWATPLVNSALIAGAWMLLIRAFDLKPNILVLLGLILISLQPLYASAVLVDAWFFPAIVLLAASLRHSPLMTGAVAGLLLSAHGSGQIMAVVFAVLAFLLCRSRRPVWAAVIAAVVAFGMNAVLDASIEPDTPRLARTFPAARVFSVQPELLVREADRSGNVVLEESAALVIDLKADPENRLRRDLFWDVWKQTQGRFDLVEFESRHALPILKDAWVYRPSELVRAVLQDFASFYGPDTEFDFRPVLSETFPPPFQSSWQAEGVFSSSLAEGIATFMRYMLYAIFVTAILFYWNKADPLTRRNVIAITLLVLANDFLFALLSGPPDRYHHRVLPFLAVAILLLVSPRSTPRKAAAAEIDALPESGQ